MRAIVRGDLDGLVSASLLLSIKQISEILIVDLKEFLDGSIEVTDQDILCNLPYDEKLEELIFNGESLAQLNGKPVMSCIDLIIDRIGGSNGST